MTINILQIIRGLDIGGDSGGAELFGIKLARELNKITDCKVWICAFYSVGTKTEKEWLNKLNEEGITTFFVSEWEGYNNFRKFFKGISQLITKIPNEKFDVIHSHFQLGTLAACILKLFNKTKTAYRTSHIRREWNKGKFTWILSPIFIKRVFPHYLNGEIGVSKAVCKYLIDRRPGKINESKVHLIYNGIDIENFNEKRKKSLSQNELSLLNSGKFRIGCVGRLAEQKGYPYIIDSMKDISEIIPDSVLFIVGDGELKNELISKVDNLNLSDRIIFLGLCNNVPAIMKHWDLFVLPSLWEGFPTVVMEAMLSKIPIIATNIPGTNELVKDYETGILVPIKDTKELAKNIVKLYKDKLLRNSLVENAARQVINYSMESIAQDYYNLFVKNLN